MKGALPPGVAIPSMEVKTLRPKKNGRPSTMPLGSMLGAPMSLNAVRPPEANTLRASTTLIGADAVLPFCPATVSVRLSGGDGHRKPAAVGSLAGHGWLLIDDGIQNTVEPLSTKPSA